MSANIRSIIVVVFLFTAGTLRAQSLDTLFRLGDNEFAQGNYGAAAGAFAKAEQAAPNDLRIPYNQGCALIAAGKYEEAIVCLRRSALAKDPKLASLSLEQIGNACVESAKKTLGEMPDTLDAEKQPLVLDLMERAVDSYQAAAELDPQNGDLIGNTENVRLWSERMKSTWKINGLKERRFRTQPLAYAESIDKELHKLHAEALAFADIPDTPKKYQTMRTTAESMNSLANEATPIREIIELHFDADLPIGSPGITAEVAALKGPLDRFATDVRDGAKPLGSYKNITYFGSLTDAMRELDLVKTQLKQYENILREAISLQESCIARPPKDSDERARIAWEQRLLEKRMPILVMRANQGSVYFDANPPFASGSPSLASNSQDAPNSAAASIDEQIRKDKLRMSMNLAQTIGPQAEQNIIRAHKELQNGSLEEAAIEQNKALELLRRIAEPLDKPDEPPKNDPENQTDNEKSNKNDSPRDGNPDNKPQEPPDNPAKNEEDNNKQNDDNEKKDSGDNEQQKAEPVEKQNVNESQDNNKTPESDKPNRSEQTGRANKDKIDSMFRKVQRRQQEGERRRKEDQKLIDSKYNDDIKDW